MTGRQEEIPMIFPNGPDRADGQPGSAPPILNLAAAEHRLNGERELLGELLARVRHQGHDVVETAGHAVRSGDLPLARSLLHKLRGAAGNVGAEALAAVAGDLEQLLRDDAVAPQVVTGMLQKLSQEALRLNLALSNLPDRAGSPPAPADMPEPGERQDALRGLSDELGAHTVKAPRSFDRITLEPETRRQTVMVVDDEPVNIRILTKILGGDYDVRCVSNGPDALELLESFQPDIILLDIRMPAMNGYELCSRLKSNVALREIPVVFITTMNQLEDEIRGLKAGAVDYISKPFAPEIIRLRVRNQLAIKQNHDSYKRQSLLDGLTNIPNRRAFEEQLQREWSRCQRNQGNISLLMIDIDDFKLYNDTYGHLKGDECLRQVGEVLLSSLRASDYPARYGGEEFVCILADTAASMAYLVAERIRRRVASCALPHRYSTAAPHVTISVGVATNSLNGVHRAADLLDEADRMLYVAKKSGKNCTWQCPES